MHDKNLTSVHIFYEKSLVYKFVKCNEWRVTRLMFTVFRKEMAAYIKTTYNRSNCQLTSNQQATNSSGFLPNKAAQPKSNQTDTNWTETMAAAAAAAEIIEEHKMTVLMFD